VFRRDHSRLPLYSIGTPITHSPHPHHHQLTTLSAKHPLCRALRERTRAADRGTVPLFPCLELLRAGWTAGRAVLVLPWLVEYMRMMRWDPISARTRYYQVGR
jgi:hypothetical protein